MSEQRVYDKTKSHYGNLIGDTGVDTHTITIPSGFKFTRARVDAAQGNMGVFWITERPAEGSTGKQKIKVRWAYPPFDKVRYRVRAYASDTAEDVLVIDILRDSRWKSKALEAISRKQPFRLVVRGDLAKEMHDALGLSENGTKNLTAYVVAESAGLIGLAALGIVAMTVAYVLMVAISHGCDAKATGKGKDGDLLYFDVKCKG